MIPLREPKWVVPESPSSWKETGRTELKHGALFQLWQVPKPKDPSRMYYQLWIYDPEYKGRQYCGKGLVNAVRHLLEYSHVPGTYELLGQVLFLLKEMEQKE